jgi:hypothetical protein
LNSCAPAAKDLEPSEYEFVPSTTNQPISEIAQNQDINKHALLNDVSEFNANGDDGY